MIQRKIQDITPSEMFEATVRVRERLHGRVTQQLVSDEFCIPNFGFIFASAFHWSMKLQFAYKYAKAGRPYPAKLDDPEYNPFDGPPD